LKPLKPGGSLSLDCNQLKEERKSGNLLQWQNSWNKELMKWKQIMGTCSDKQTTSSLQTSWWTPTSWTEKLKYTWNCCKLCSKSVNAACQ
jgi:hypothetical protein